MQRPPRLILVLRELSLFPAIFHLLFCLNTHTFASHTIQCWCQFYHMMLAHPTLFQAPACPWIFIHNPATNFSTTPFSAMSTKTLQHAKSSRHIKSNHTPSSIPPMQSPSSTIQKLFQKHMMGDTDNTYSSPPYKTTKELCWELTTSFLPIQYPPPQT